MVLVIIVAVLAIFVVGWMVLGALGSAAGMASSNKPMSPKQAARVAQMEREQAEFDARKELAKREAMKRLEAEG